MNKIQKMKALKTKGKLPITHGVGKEIKMKDIIIKLRENEDRSVIFKLPMMNKPDLKLALHPLKQGTLQVSWELEDYKNEIVKEDKDGKINNKNEK